MEKLEFIPHKDPRAMDVVVTLDDVREDDSWRQDPPGDDVWLGKYYKWKIYSLAEAIQCHKETHSMGMFDTPNGFIRAKIELDMTGHRPSKPAGEISIAEYDYAVAHPNMMAEVLLIKGLLKRKFPNAAAGSLGIDVSGMVTKFISGINYRGFPHERYRLYGTAVVYFGRLDMDTKHLEENLAVIIKDINAHRPKRAGEFMTRIRITTEVERERLKIDHRLYTVDEKKNQDDDDDDEDDDDDHEPVATAV